MIGRSGFTLAKFAVELVVIGLIVGSFFVIQSMTHAADLRSIATQSQRYKAAVTTFRDKYHALPGDMKNAQDFWGAADISPGACVITASVGTKTCNGDGNGKIDVSKGSNERFRFWQHLSNAGLITGIYSGIAQGITSDAATPINSPTGGLDTSLWYVTNLGTIKDDATLFNGDYHNILLVGGMVANHYPSASILKPEEALGLDTKLDDGKPATGKIVVGSFKNCTKAVNSKELDAYYSISNSKRACTLIMREAF